MSKKLDAAKLTLGLKKEIKKENLKPNLENNIETVVKKIHENNFAENTREEEQTKRTTLDIPKTLHKKISRCALDKDLTLKDYFLALARKDLGLE